MSDTQVAQPEMEVREFSEAEKKAFEKRAKPYREAAEAVNGFVEFLKEQHNIADNEGWQLGNGCFVREAVARPHPEGSRPAQSAPVNRTQERERRAKKLAAPVKAKPVAVEQGQQNGVPERDVAL